MNKITESNYSDKYSALMRQKGYFCMLLYNIMLQLMFIWAPCLFEIQLRKPQPILPLLEEFYALYWLQRARHVNSF